MRQGDPLPDLICNRADAPPIIDGALDDAVWRRTPGSDAFWRLMATDCEVPAKPRLPTRVRCLWGQGNLYVGFDCRSPDVWAAKTQRDDALWYEPVVEVFLDPDGRGESFFEFQVNPLGTIYDSYVANAVARDDWRRWCRWNCDRLQVAVKIDGTLNDLSRPDAGWSAELAIPFDSLARQTGAPPRTGTVWRANFCRYDYSADLTAPELSCWAPAVEVFDNPSCWGFLRFAD